MALALSVLALAGCESTQDRSARLAKLAKHVDVEHGITVARENPDVKVLRTAWVRDRYGVAAVVELRSKAKRAQANLPLAFTVKGPGGSKQYTNDLAGLSPTLTHVALLRPGEHVWWVNDQVSAAHPKTVVAKVGGEKGTVPKVVPKLVPTKLSLTGDSSGTYTRGMLRNESAIDQRQVMVYGVAQRHGRVVAAGRGGIERIKPHKQALFRVFWIGDPKGATVHLFAPPTTLTQEG
jgi:hypothetical protein